MGEILIIHAADARGPACCAASQLAAEGHSVRRCETTPDDKAGACDLADHVLIIWSKDLSGDGPHLDAARKAAARRILIPIAVAGTEPPAAFADLWPIDLDGWQGEADDPRWQFVHDEIRLARLRADAAGSAPPRPQRSAAPPRRRRFRIETSILIRMIPLAAAGLAVLSAMAVLVATPPAHAPDARPAANKRASAGESTPASSALSLRNAAPITTSVLAGPVEDPSPQALAPSDPVDLVARLLGDNSAPAREDITAPAGATVIDEPTGVDFPPAIADSPQPEFETDTLEAVEVVEAPPAESESAEDAPATEATAEITAAAEPDGQQSREPEETALEPLPLPPPAPDDYAGIVFRDCLDCPDMAEIPAGQFQMGAAPGEAGAVEAETPARTVAIARPFALSRREVSFKEWQACVDDGGCRSYNPPDAGWGRGKRPVINVSWQDAQSYVAWLAMKTGQPYRLPSEAEWEYAAQAGRAVSAASAGVISPMRANYEDGARARTAPAASFAPSAFGLYDMLGNVWEWVDDCWRDSHAGAPADGSPVGGECATGVLKGGAYNSSAWRLRPAHRIAKARNAREADNGFRVARDLP